MLRTAFAPVLSPEPGGINWLDLAKSAVAALAASGVIGTLLVAAGTEASKVVPAVVATYVVSVVKDLVRAWCGTPVA